MKMSKGKIGASNPPAKGRKKMAMGGYMKMEKPKKMGAYGGGYMSSHNKKKTKKK